MGWFERGRKEIPGGYSESQEFAGFPLLYARYASTRRKDEIAVRNSVSSTEIHSTTLNIHFQTVFEDKRWYRKFWLVLENKNILYIYVYIKEDIQFILSIQNSKFHWKFHWIFQQELIAFSFVRNIYTGMNLTLFIRWIFKKLK